MDRKWADEHLSASINTWRAADSSLQEARYVRDMAIGWARASGIPVMEIVRRSGLSEPMVHRILRRYERGTSNDF